MPDYGPYKRPQDIRFEDIPWGSIKKFIPPLLIIIFVVITGYTAFYTVKANEEAVILRFGRYIETVGPGLHTKVPYGIDRILKAEVKRIYNEEFGFRTEQYGFSSMIDYEYPEAKEEKLMLTGDLNCADVHWVIRYKIKALEEFFFNVRDVRETIRGVSQAVMRALIGDRSIDEVLTIGRTEIEQKAREDIQKILDNYKCGIDIQTVLLKGVDPPEPVKDAFNAVNQAIQIRDKIINDAEGQKNKILPAAEGKKEQVIKEAEGYRIRRVNEATGDIKAFLAIYEEYKKAEDVTRRRLFLETMSKVIPKCERLYIIDKDIKGLLPMFEINEEGVKQ
ncbi:MAG: FtsH protease activity modulator HflK [Candidatus Brocadia sp.]|nr:FtsH protease activity modulator HflK [Candidatus Brocadia sp.]NUO08331.1 FtsH protease activity modulator HflK [Candidatus Brocadia sp.]